MLKFLKDETGISVVITALVMTVLLTFAALTVDIGAAYVKASEAQNAADAIALSVGNYLPLNLDDEAAISKAKAAAYEYAEKNGAKNFNADNVSFGDVQNGKYRSVSVSVDKQSSTSFARIIGVDNINIIKSATVSAENAGSVYGAVPIGIVEDTYDNAIAAGSTQHVKLKVGGGDGDTGFYGFIVLDDSKGNAVVLEKWLKYGYEGTNYVGQLLPVATGNKTSTARDGVAYRLSLCNHYAGMGGCTLEHYVDDCPRIVYVLVYKFVDTRTVQIVGFTPFLIEACGSDDEIQGSFIDVNISHADETSEKDCGLYTYRLSK
jgi:Flp pilus assembly protein TadG